MKTTVLIKIHYLSSSGTRVEQKGFFRLYGRTPAETAFIWWNKEVSRGIEKTLERVYCEEEDITSQVLDIEKRQYISLWLPF